MIFRHTRSGLNTTGGTKKEAGKAGGERHRMDPVLFLGVRKVPLYQVPQKGNQTHHHEYGMVRGSLVVT